jgi:hypothetical protein
MAITNTTVSQTYPRFQSLVYPTVTVANETTAAAVTYTVTQLLGGFLARDPNGAGRADLVPTAAAIVAAIPGVLTGASFEFELRNAADAAETITVTTNTGISLSGTMTIAQNNQKRFIVQVTNALVGSEAVTIFSCGTVVF